MTPGTGDDQRDAQRRVEEVLAVVEVVVVLAQALAVVRGERSTSVRSLTAARPEGVEDPPHLLVDGRDLAVVLRDVVAEPVLARHRPLLRDAAVEAGDDREPRPGAASASRNAVSKGGGGV